MSLLFTNCIGTNTILTTKLKSTYPLFPVVERGGFGYINQFGQTVIEAKYDFAADFFDGLARVKSDGKWFFLDTSGQIVMSLDYPLVYDFQDGFALVQLDQPKLFENTQFGLIDKKGQVKVKTISSKYYNSEQLNISTIYHFLLDKYRTESSQKIQKKYINLSHHKLIRKNNQTIMVNEDGDIVKALSDGLQFGSFREGMLAVKEGDYWGFMDEEGQWMIFPQFVNPKPPVFSEGLAAALEPNTNNYGFVDKTGRWVIEPVFDEVNTFSEGLASARLGFKWGIIDNQGKIIIPFSFDEELYFFKKGLCKFKRRTKYNYINIEGEIIWEEVIPQ